MHVAPFGLRRELLCASHRPMGETEPHDSLLLCLHMPSVWNGWSQLHRTFLPNIGVLILAALCTAQVAGCLVLLLNYINVQQ